MPPEPNGPEPILTGGPPPFVGLSHADVLDLTFDGEPSDLIEDLVPMGVVVTTVGLPETYKGWVAQQKGRIIAAGAGEIFGCRAVRQGPVGYFGQDDSTRNEAERVQLAARVHGTPRDLPITWFLNEGLSLPDDLDRLADTIAHHGFVYLVLDSFYNVANVDLKETGAGALVAKIKNEICDATGCTVDLVDHMPWATQTNRGRLRGYGDVFKNAAIRAGIYIDAEHNKLWVEARGNNIRGFKRTPAYWDETNLELRLVDTTHAEESFDEIVATVITWLEDHPGRHSTSTVRKAVKGRDSTIDSALETLKARAEVRDLGRAGGPWSAEPGTPRYWEATIHAASDLFTTPAHNNGPRSAEVTGNPAGDDLGPPPIGGRGTSGPRSNLTETDLEELLQKHADLAQPETGASAELGASEAEGPIGKDAAREPESEMIV